MSQPTSKRRRGFAAMDPKRQREIASMGGVSAHRLGRAHQFTHEEAVAAAKKGATARARKSAGLAA